jgi:hypothetical protein
VLVQSLFTLKRPSAPPAAARGVYLGERRIGFFIKNPILLSLKYTPVENQNTDVIFHKI